MTVYRAANEGVRYLSRGTFKAQTSKTQSLKFSTASEKAETKDYAF